MQGKPAFRWSVDLEGLAKKGGFDPKELTLSVFTLIDMYQDLLKGVAASSHPNFCYVDLRDLIDPDRDWVNELHLRNSAYARVPNRIHARERLMACQR